MSFWTGTSWECDESSPSTSARPSRRRHVAEALAEGAMIALLAAGLVAGTTLAAKGGNSAHQSGGHGSATSSSLSLVMVTDANDDGLPNWADTVTFDPSTGATSSPQVRLECYQGGALVYNANAAWYDGNPFAYMQMMKLESGAWTGGAADCTATMYYLNHRKTVTLATLDFHVGA